MRDARKVEERPPRRRVHMTAEVARRPYGSDWGWSAPPAVISRRKPVPKARQAQRLTVRIGALGQTLRDVRSWTARRSKSWGYLLMIVPAVLVVAALLAI